MAARNKQKKRAEPESDLCFADKPMSVVESTIRWPHRYQSKKTKLQAPTKKPANKGYNFTGFVSFMILLLSFCLLILFYSGKKEDEEIIKQAKCHFDKALVDGVLIILNDDVYVTVSFLSICVYILCCYAFCFVEMLRGTLSMVTVNHR